MIWVNLHEIKKNSPKPLQVVEMITVPRIGEMVAVRKYEKGADFNIYEVTQVYHRPTTNKYVETREEEAQLEAADEIVEYDAEVIAFVKLIDGEDEFWKKFEEDKKKSSLN